VSMEFWQGLRRIRHLPSPLAPVSEKTCNTIGFECSSDGVVASAEQSIRGVNYLAKEISTKFKISCGFSDSRRFASTNPEASSTINNPAQRGKQLFYIRELFHNHGRAAATPPAALADRHSLRPRLPPAAPVLAARVLVGPVAALLLHLHRPSGPADFAIRPLCSHPRLQVLRGRKGCCHGECQRKRQLVQS
jgi:hypothetical protein